MKEHQQRSSKNSARLGNRLAIGFVLRPVSPLAARVAIPVVIRNVRKYAYTKRDEESNSYLALPQPPHLRKTALGFLQYEHM